MLIRTYKRKLKLNAAQMQRINSWIGACRVVYNLAMEVKQMAYKSAQKTVSKYDLLNQLPELKKDIPWIADVPAQTLQAVVERLDRSYQNFFRSFKKGGGYPRFVSKKSFQSITFKAVSVKGDQVVLPKIGVLRLFKDAPVPGNPKTAQLVREATGYFLCIQCELTDIPVSKPSESQAIGIDMGIAQLATLSNQQNIFNPGHFQKYERTLRIANRSLARKKKGSNRWKKQAYQVRLLHHKLARTRKDFLHKESTRIARQHSLVFVEDLKITNMSKSAAGTIEEPGKNVAAKSGLNRSILDAGWGAFRTMLEYKTTVIRVSPKYTSQICSHCGHKDAASRRSQSRFECTSCGHQANADANAARNILSQGLARYRQREAVACA